MRRASNFGSKRLENLETIVCGVDLELNQKLHKLLDEQKLLTTGAAPVVVPPAMQVVTPETVDHAVTEELTLEDGSQSRVTHYFGSRGVESETVPDAFLVEYRPAPGCDIRPHFHRLQTTTVHCGSRTAHS